MAVSMKIEGLKSLSADILDLKKRFERFNKQGVTIGYIEAPSLRRKGGKNVADNLNIATWQEFGTNRGIPPRPFLHPALLMKEKDVLRRIEQAVVDEGLGNKLGAVKRSLEYTGMEIRDQAKANIVAQRNFTPLAPATIQARRRAGFVGTKALIRTGQLLNAIQYVVKDK